MDYRKKYKRYTKEMGMIRSDEIYEVDNSLVLSSWAWRPVGRMRLVSVLGWPNVAMTLGGTR